MAKWISRSIRKDFRGSITISCMSLIKCPDCGKEVSDKAPVCPNCGRPIAPSGIYSFLSQRWIVIIGAIIIIYIGMRIMGGVIGAYNRYQIRKIEYNLSE